MLVYDFRSLVLRIFTSITRIAQIETRVRKGAFRTVNLVEIAHEVVELYDAAAEQAAPRSPWSAAAKCSRLAIEI